MSEKSDDVEQDAAWALAEIARLRKELAAAEARGYERARGRAFEVARQRAKEMRDVGAHPAARECEVVAARISGMKQESETKQIAAMPCEGPADCGGHNGGPCPPCKARAADGIADEIRAMTDERAEKEATPQPQTERLKELLREEHWCPECGEGAKAMTAERVERPESNSPALVMTCPKHGAQRHDAHDNDCWCLK